MSEGTETETQQASAGDSVAAPVCFQFEKLNAEDDIEYIPPVHVAMALEDEAPQELSSQSRPTSTSDNSPPGPFGSGRQMHATTSFNDARRGSGATSHSLGTTPSAISPLAPHNHHSHHFGETGGAIGSNRSPGVGSIRSASTFNNKPSFATYEEEEDSEDDATSHKALGSASLAGNNYTVGFKYKRSNGEPTPTTTTTTTSTTTTTTGTKSSRTSTKDDEHRRLILISPHPQAPLSNASATFGSSNTLLRPSISVGDTIDPPTCASPKLRLNRPTGLMLMVPSPHGGPPEVATALPNPALAGVYCTPEGEQALRNLVAAAAAQQLSAGNVLSPHLGSALTVASAGTCDTTAAIWNGRDSSMPTTPQEHHTRVMRSLPNTPFVAEGTPYFSSPGNYYSQHKVPQSTKLRSPQSGAGNQSFVSVAGSVANSADVGAHADLDGFHGQHPTIIGDSSPNHGQLYGTGHWHMGDPNQGVSSPANRFANEFVQYHLHNQYTGQPTGMQAEQYKAQAAKDAKSSFSVSVQAPPANEHGKLQLPQPLPTANGTMSQNKTNNSSFTMSEGLDGDDVPQQRQITGQFFEVSANSSQPIANARAPPPGYVAAPRMPPPVYNSVVPEYPDPLQVMKGETGPAVNVSQPRTQYGSGKGGATRLVSRFMPPPPPSLQAARVMAVCSRDGAGDAYYSRPVKNIDPKRKVSPVYEPLEDSSITEQDVSDIKAATIAALEKREFGIHNDGKTCVATGDFAFLTKTQNTADWARAGYGPCYSATTAEGAPDTTFSLFDTKSEAFQNYLEVLMQWYARTVRAVGHNSPTSGSGAHNPIGMHPDSSSTTTYNNQSISFGEDPLGASDSTAAPLGGMGSLSGSVSISKTPTAKLPSSYFSLNTIPPCPRPENYFEIDRVEEGGDESSKGNTNSSSGLLVINDLNAFIQWHNAVHEWWATQVQPRTIGYHLHVQQLRGTDGSSSQAQQGGEGNQQSNGNYSRGGYNNNNRGGGNRGGRAGGPAAMGSHFVVHQQPGIPFNVPSFHHPPQYQPMYPNFVPPEILSPHHQYIAHHGPGFPQPPAQHPVANWFQLVPQQRADSQQLPW